jgi:aryl-alcohol dehydrogenase-like predicted oxidoreductase
VTAPIVGATTPEHLADAVAAVELELSTAELERLEQHYTPRAASGF